MKAPGVAGLSWRSCATAARGRRPAATAIGEASGPRLVSHGVRHTVVEPRLRRRPPLEGGVRRTAGSLSRSLVRRPQKALYWLVN